MYSISIVLLLSVKSVMSANILFVSLVPSPSHHIWNRALAFGLASKGYNVTLFGPDKDKTVPANYHHIHVEGVYENFPDSTEMIAMSDYTQFKMLQEFVEISVLICKLSLNSQGFQRLLNYPRDFKFDLIIYDVSLGPCFYPLIHKFNYPTTIGVTPFLLPPYVAFNFGNHLYPAYNPWYGLPYTKDMNFFERVWNFLFTYGETFAKHVKQYKEEYEAAKKIFGDDIPSATKLERHISLILTNTDPVLDYSRPLAPNFIAVGGLHTRVPKEIPKDFQSILEDAKNGVIIFSLGTNIRSDTLDKKTQNELIDAFSKLSQVVIWKFESDLDKVPKNVIVRKWLPQNDLLSHPNVKLFIGHGGALSTQEAIFHGVPMLCVPFFFDQHVNTRAIIDRKLGISLNYRKITSEYVLNKIQEVLNNPIYSKNMRKASQAFRDRTETPLERSIFWAEYAVRHYGAPFLSTPARDLSFYQASGLDVLAFLIFVVILLCVLVFKIFSIILGQFEPKKIKIN